jgi:hypothetical protein
VKRIVIILLFVFPLVSSFRTGDNSRRESLPSLGFIDIVVESNVNRMLFSYQLSKNSLIINDYKVPVGMEDTTAIIIMVPVKDFQCGNPFGYKDFITLLKANQYPFMKIEIPRKVFFQQKGSTPLIISGVSLSVAGVSGNYDLLCNVEQLGDDNKLIIGTTMIRLTDMKIDPPVKSMGLVKIRNEIIVNFGFRLNAYLAENINH